MLMFLCYVHDDHPSIRPLICPFRVNSIRVRGLRERGWCPCYMLWRGKSKWVNEFVEALSLTNSLDDADDDSWP